MLPSIANTDINNYHINFNKKACYARPPTRSELHPSYSSDKAEKSIMTLTYSHRKNSSVDNVNYNSRTISSEFKVKKT